MGAEFGHAKLVEADAFGTGFRKKRGMKRARDADENPPIGGRKIQRKRRRIAVTQSDSIDAGVNLAELRRATEFNPI